MDFLSRGFGSRWIYIIDSIDFSNSSSSIRINGTPDSGFKNKRGLKQGNPLSPQLFILVADVLNMIFNLANSEGLAAGIEPYNITRNLQCLQFADDTIIFSSMNKEHIENLKFIIVSFELLIELKISFSKT